MKPIAENVLMNRPNGRRLQPNPCALHNKNTLHGEYRRNMRCVSNVRNGKIATIHPLTAGMNSRNYGQHFANDQMMCIIGDSMLSADEPTGYALKLDE